MSSRVVAALLAAIAAGFLPSSGALAVGETATAAVKLADGKDAGTVTFTEATAGVLIKYELKGLAPGKHGVHVHETGKCEGDFSSAGGIYNPLGAKHGFLHDEGPMAGDLPNLYAAADGTVVAEVLSPFLTLSKEAEETLFDNDKTAVVVFATADNYESEPDGEAGARIACGVLVTK
jgi:superoxide dismutase, Cu-Zn family